jgi:hypothetical protein
MEPRGRLDERGARVDGDPAREPFFLVGQRTGLQDRLHRKALRGAHDRRDVGRCGPRIAALQRAQIEHGVDLARAVREREFGRARLRFRPVAAMRKPDDADHARFGAGQRARGERDVAGLHAVEPDAPRAHDVRARFDVGGGRLRLQHGMVAHAGELVAGHGVFPVEARSAAMRAARCSSSFAASANSGVVSGTP